MSLSWMYDFPFDIRLSGRNQLYVTIWMIQIQIRSTQATSYEIR